MVLAGAISTRHAKLDLDDPLPRRVFRCWAAVDRRFGNRLAKLQLGRKAALRDESLAPSLTGGQGLRGCATSPAPVNLQLQLPDRCGILASTIDQIDAIAGIARNVLVIPDSGGAYMNSQRLSVNHRIVADPACVFNNGRLERFRPKKGFERMAADPAAG